MYEPGQREKISRRHKGDSLPGVTSQDHRIKQGGSVLPLSAFIFQDISGGSRPTAAPAAEKEATTSRSATLGAAQALHAEQVQDSGWQSPIWATR